MVGFQGERVQVRFPGDGVRALKASNLKCVKAPLAEMLATAQFELLRINSPCLLDLPGQMFVCHESAIQKHFTAVLGQNPGLRYGPSYNALFKPMTIRQHLLYTNRVAEDTSSSCGQYEVAMEALTGHSAFHSPPA